MPDVIRPELRAMPAAPEREIVDHVAVYQAARNAKAAAMWKARRADRALLASFAET